MNRGKLLLVRLLLRQLLVLGAFDLRRRSVREERDTLDAHEFFTLRARSLHYLSLALDAHRSMRVYSLHFLEFLRLLTWLTG